MRSTGNFKKFEIAYSICELGKCWSDMIVEDKEVVIILYKDESKKEEPLEVCTSSWISHLLKTDN